MEQLSFFETIDNTPKTSDSDLARMKELHSILNEAARAYYQEAREIMPNHEYDALYDELLGLEERTGTVLSGSPTHRVGYEVLSELPKEAHPTKMLSLNKTKSVQDLASMLGSNTGIMSWKLDGLTIVLTYENGELTKAVTRGNGEVGEVITGNARTFTNTPLKISFKGKLVLRGEAVITYDDFNKINETISDESSKYKNPRNLCSGSVRQLDPSVTASRRVQFHAFSLVSAEEMEFRTRQEQFEWLASLGFSVVSYKLVVAESGSEDRVSVSDAVHWFSEHIESNPVPSDGLVLSFNDLEYSRTLGVTAKFPRDSIAFKWQDELAETTLKEIEWSASRTGLINPVAIFDPVELEGTTVSRASVHNISVMQELKLGIGDRIKVYKANMIIPQISENLTGSGNVEIPKVCPVCGGFTLINDLSGVKTLTCPNPHCPAKQIKGFTHFVSRDAMDMDGLSEMTLEKLIDEGLIREPADLYHIEKYHDTIVRMEGFGELSFKNLTAAVERARHPSAQKFLYSLGIPNIGKANAALISNHCENKWDRIRSLSKEELMTIDGIGEIMADCYVKFFRDEDNIRIVDDLLNEVEIDESYESSGEKFAGMTFVITGSLINYPNRDALKAEIEANGGKVAGSVSAKTTYLINNDISSTSGKNKKAKELGVPIISEEDYTRL